METSAIMQTEQRVDARPSGGVQPSREEKMLKLRAAAQQFESLFVQTLLRTMRQTVPKSELTESNEVDTYRQMLDEAMSKRIGGAGGLGIAEMVTRQYMPYVSGDGPPDTHDSPGMAPVPSDGKDGATPARMRPLATDKPSRLPELSRALAAYAEAGDSGEPGRSLGARAQALGGAAADTVRRWGDRIETEARRHDLAPELVLAVVVQESAGRPDAVSPVGATGLMQLMPGTAREVGVNDPLDPDQNIAGGTRYLAHLRERFGDDLELVLAAYNAGPGNVRRAGDAVPPFAETREYVRKVSELYGELEGSASLAYGP